MWFELFAALLLTPIFCTVLFVFYTWARKLCREKRRTIAFFHPFYETGGGGERVLWCALEAIGEIAAEMPDSAWPRVVIYSGAPHIAPEDAFVAAEKRFGLKLSWMLESSPSSHPPLVEVVQVPWRWLLDAKLYPRLTMLGQSFGSWLFGCIAIAIDPPDVFVDTTGWAWTFLPAWLSGATVAAYVHYPTISSNMLQRVASGSASFNNSTTVSSSPFLTSMKLWYYRAFAAVYGCCGRLAAKDAVLVNSSWTQGHIDAIWFGKKDAEDSSSSSSSSSPSSSSPSSSSIVVFPPCNTDALSELDLDRERRIRWSATSTSPASPSSSSSRRRSRRSPRLTPHASEWGGEEGGGEGDGVLSSSPLVVISVAQFRPEKNHALQLEAMAELKEKWGEKFDFAKRAKLVMVGGVRNEGDAKRVQDLVNYAKELGLRVAPVVHGEKQLEDEANNFVEKVAPKVLQEADVLFHTNATLDALRQWMGRAAAGLHSMRDEHFGIGVVELMAAGAVPVAHDSGGPRMDIVVEHDGVPTGLRASTASEYATAIARVLAGAIRDRTFPDAIDWDATAHAGRKHAKQFSDEHFRERFLKALGPVLF